MGRLMNKIKNAFSSISLITYALVVIFGTGSWIAINGLWVELPIIVQEIPESWSLPSYLTVIIQLANIAPLAFALGNKFFPRVVREVPIIYISVIVGIAACTLLAFFWKETSYIAGAERSTALLVLCFFFSMVDCCSSVTFLPYMAIFQGVYMSPYFAGQGLSGLLPSLVALAQGVGGGSHTSCVNPTLPPVNATNETSANNTAVESLGPGPKFSVEVFFWFLSIMMMACGLAFLGLNYLPVAKRQQVAKNYEEGADQDVLAGDQALELVSKEERLEYNKNSPGNDDLAVEYLSTSGVAIMLLIIAFVSGLSNGVIPAIQSYACIPYSYCIYHLTLTLSNIVNPVTCFVFPLISTTSLVVITVLSFVYFGLCTYILIIASQSPTVLLRCEDSGAALIVVISVIAIAVVTYIKVAVGGLMREQGHKHLLWYGISTQVGSCVGALAIFAPVNIWRLLTAFVFYPIVPQTGFHYLINMYFLYSYSTRLETGLFDGRPADYLFMILFNGCILIIIGFLMPLRLLMDPLVLSVLYVWCQVNKDMIVQFWFGMQFKAMYLPWVLAVFNMIIQGGGIMELIGIFVGHLYFFLMFKYPQDFGGRRFLTTPSILYKFLPNRQGGVSGFGVPPASRRPRDQDNGGGGGGWGGWGRGNRLGNE